MKSISRASENIFRLLVPATDSTPLDTPSVELCGRRWRLTEWMPISEAPPYTCISYSWGSGRIENMFEAGQLMSDRTIPAIEATITVSQSPEHWINALICTPRDTQKEANKLSDALNASQAIWIDELCIPFRGAARDDFIKKNLGIIYNSASQVCAVLSKSCSELLNKIYSTGRMTSDDLFILDKEEWFHRFWTYIELANSKFTLFIAQGDCHALILAQDLLNTVLTDTTDYAKTHGFEQYRLAKLFPGLEILQSAIAEHSLAEYTGRSAYQVMSSVHQRNAVQAEYRMTAMICLIATLPSDRLDEVSLQPSEYFMRVCEVKGDFSFLYCTAPRSDMPGRNWRPVSDQLQPILSGLLASGSGLSGCLYATHLQLHNMCRMNPGRLNTVTKSIGNFLQVNIPVSILEQLRQKGFTGCGEYLELENGYFFPQSSFTRSKDLFIVASEDVIWAQGAPGMLLRSNGTDINQFCDVGVFIGRLPKGGESINVG